MLSDFAPVITPFNNIGFPEMLGKAILKADAVIFANSQQKQRNSLANRAAE